MRTILNIAIAILFCVVLFFLSQIPRNGTRMANGLVAEGTVTQGTSIEEMNRQPRKQKPIITYGDELPPGVTRESIEEAERAPKCDECKDWSGQWINGRFVIKHNGRDVTDEVTGPNIFSKTPPFSRRR